MCHSCWTHHPIQFSREPSQCQDPKGEQRELPACLRRLGISSLVWSQSIGGLGPWLPITCSALSILAKLTTPLDTSEANYTTTPLDQTASTITTASHQIFKATLYINWGSSHPPSLILVTKRFIYVFLSSCLPSPSQLELLSHSGTLRLGSHIVINCHTQSWRFDHLK